jgi:hypothetical protein
MDEEIARTNFMFGLHLTMDHMTERRMNNCTDMTHVALRNQQQLAPTTISLKNPICNATFVTAISDSYISQIEFNL